MQKISHPNQDLTKPTKRKKQPKPIRRVSKKQAEYERWLIKVARPHVIERDGDICQCCKRVHYPHDLDHIKGKGSHPELKRDLDNFQILCRPCHHLKTINKACVH